MNRLLLPAFDNPEIIFEQPFDWTALGIRDGDIENHEVHIDGQLEIARAGIRSLLARGRLR